MQVQIQVTQTGMLIQWLLIHFINQKPFSSLKFAIYKKNEIMLIFKWTSQLKIIWGGGAFSEHDGYRVTFLSTSEFTCPLFILCLLQLFSLALRARNDVNRQRFARTPPGLLLSLRCHSSRSHFLPEWGFLCSFISSVWLVFFFLSLSWIYSVLFTVP